MIWLNKAKEFLNYITAQELDLVKQMCDDKASKRLDRFNGFTKAIIKNTAYKDKLIFIELEGEYRDYVFVIEFDSFGKICYCEVY